MQIGDTPRAIEDARRIWAGMVRDIGSTAVDDQLTYLEYQIGITQEGPRFTARVTRNGGLIEHDGRASEVWVSASCNTRDRAVWVAKNAIDTDRIR